MLGRRESWGGGGGGNGQVRRGWWCVLEKQTRGRFGAGERDRVRGDGVQ